MTKPTGRRKVQYLPEAENDLIIIGGADGPAYPVDTAEPVPAPEPEPEPQPPVVVTNAVYGQDESFFDDALFIGDSRMVNVANLSLIHI